MSALRSAPQSTQWAWCNRKWVISMVMGGQLDDLMGVIERGGGTLPLATGTGRWIDVLHGGGREQGYSRACMALACPRLSEGVRRVGLVKDESDAGGLLEVLEVLSRRACSVSNWYWIC